MDASWDPRVPLSPLRPDDPSQFGPYRVLGRLGSGGLGDAFLAQDSNSWVVVKAVRPGVADTSALRARLAREINAISLISSPFVAGLLGSDLEAPRPWFAMEFVPGITLERSVSEEGPLPGPDLSRFAHSLAEAIESVHAAGVIHRDLKPSNVMLAPKGPVLIDFGIAQVAGSTRLTQDGMSLGTLFWMAPEQVIGEPATKATDVHAWGLVTYFAATGRAPFNGETSVAAMYQVLNVTPSLPDGFPPDLKAAVDRALAKDARRRPTMPELRAMLSQPGAFPPGATQASANHYWATPQPGQVAHAYLSVPEPPKLPGNANQGAAGQATPPPSPLPEPTVHAAVAPDPGPAADPERLRPARRHRDRHAAGDPVMLPVGAHSATGSWAPDDGSHPPAAGYPGGRWPGPQPGGPAHAAPDARPPRRRNLVLAIGAGVLLVGLGAGGAVIALGDRGSVDADPTPSESGESSANAADAGSWDRVKAAYSNYIKTKPGQWSQPVHASGTWTAIAVQGVTGRNSSIELHTYVAACDGVPLWVEKDETATDWGSFKRFKFEYVDTTGQGQLDILIRAKLMHGGWTGLVVLENGSFAYFKDHGKLKLGFKDLHYADGQLQVAGDKSVNFAFNPRTRVFKVLRSKT